MINTQRAAAKGMYVHQKLGDHYENDPRIAVYRHGIDIHDYQTDVLYEVMKPGTWRQHSNPSFQHRAWQAITYE